MKPETLDELREIDIADIHSRYPGAIVEILYHSVQEDGTCAAVYEVDGLRRYRAMEYIYEDELEDGRKRLPGYCYWEKQHGYDTANKYHYMGQRYRTLFGQYEDEVFYNLANPNA